MSRLVTVDCEGEINVHLPGVGSDYATMCGLDGEDVDQRILTTKRGAKVNCETCKEFYKVCKSFRSSSLEGEL